MSAIELDVFVEASRAKRLRAATTALHEQLDASIMDASPFVSQKRYGLFLAVQHRFHREIDALYNNPVLDKLLPDLTGRRRLDLIEQDLADLGVAVPEASTAPVFDGKDDADIPAALGWLYVAEGSNLGAAFLLKEAAKLGLSEIFGARHLAAAPEGRGLHWKTFTAALDALQLNDAEDQRVIEGACHAFSAVQKAVDETLHTGAD